MVQGSVFVFVLLQLGIWVSANVVFQVHHKFAGNQTYLTAYRAHDSYRRRRFLSPAQLPLGGSGDPTTTGLYFTKIQIGSPPKDYHVQVDTGSEVLWVNCAGCSGCPKKSKLGVSLSFYDPRRSSTARLIGCDHGFCTSSSLSIPDCIMGKQCSYQIQYGDGSSTMGYYVKDRLQLDKVSGNHQIASIDGNVIFGCGTRQSGELGWPDQALDGILGLGPSRSSIVSQLARTKQVKETFSHCLAGAKGGGIFAIGEVVQPKVRTTPLFPEASSKHFSVDLQTIEVGGQFVHHAAFNRTTVIDSGSTLAYFPKEVYDQLIAKISASQPSSRSFIYRQFQCYKYSTNIDGRFPTLTFHFANSLTLTVYPHQYLFRYQDGDWCVGFQSNADQPQKEMTLLGDIVLTDKLVTYNVEDGTIGWTEYNCSSSIKVKDEETGMVYEVAGHNILSSSTRIHSRLSGGWLLFISIVAAIMF